MSITLEIIEGVRVGSGNPVFQVVENDNWKFTSHGFFNSKKDAEKYIVDFHEKYFEGK